jgi:hypothetical protein
LFSLSPNKRQCAGARFSVVKRGEPQDGRAGGSLGKQLDGLADVTKGNLTGVVVKKKESDRSRGGGKEGDNQKADGEALDSPVELGRAHGETILPKLDYRPAARVDRPDKAGADPGKVAKRRRTTKPLSLRARIMLALRQ